MVARTITVTYTAIDTAPTVSSTFAGYAYESDATKITVVHPVTFLEADDAFLADAPSKNVLYMAFRTPDGVELLSEESYSQGIYDGDTTPVTWDFIVPQAAMRHGKIQLCIVSVNRGIDAETYEYTGNEENEYEEHLDFAVQYKTRPFVLQVANAPAPDLALEVYGGTIVTEIFERLDDLDDRVDEIEGMEHNDWPGKQGGTTDQYYHLTLAQHTDLTDGGVCTVHTHAGIYDSAGTGAAEVAAHTAEADPHPQYWLGADAPAHNALDGLQGGTTDEYNHITDDEAVAVATIEGVTTSDNGKLFTIAAGVIAVDSDIKVGGTEIVLAKNVQTHPTGSNTRLGVGAYESDVDGGGNTAIGEEAGQAITSGWENTFIGEYAGRANEAASGNTAVGAYAMYQNVDGEYNTVVGMDAFTSNIEGSRNVAIGSESMWYNETGSGNVAVGNSALNGNVASDHNTAVGESALLETTGAANTAVGSEALAHNKAGENNVAIGHEAGRWQADGEVQLETPENSIYIGAQSKGKDDDDSNTIVIGFGSISDGANTIVIGNDDHTSFKAYGDPTFPALEEVGLVKADDDGVLVAADASDVGITDTGTYFTGTDVETALQEVGAALPKTVLTTEGDVLYRNSTVPARLAIGTAGKVLRVNSGATAPEWGTVSAVDNQRATANPVKFWTGTQAQYDAIGVGNYNADTVYFITAT